MLRRATATKRPPASLRKLHQPCLLECGLMLPGDVYSSHAGPPGPSRTGSSPPGSPAVIHRCPMKESFSFSSLIYIAAIAWASLKLTMTSPSLSRFHTIRLWRYIAFFIGEQPERPAWFRSIGVAQGVEGPLDDGHPFLPLFGLEVEFDEVQKLQ